MIVHKTHVQNTTLIMPSVFATATELATILRKYDGSDFCVIPSSEFTPGLTIEKKAGKIMVALTSTANARKVFDNKITSKKAKNIPLDYLYYFNMDGKVIGVSRGNSIRLSLESTRLMVEKAGLTLAQHIVVDNRKSFVHALLGQVLDAKAQVPFDRVIRVGFYMGEDKLRHTNEMAIAGILAALFSAEAGIRIQGIVKHAPAYAETVFWFELKQIAPDIFDLLKDQELKSNFMEQINKCL